MGRSFICLDCQVAVWVFEDPDMSRDRCYNCVFVSRTADSPEQEIELRKVLGCERREPVSDAQQEGQD